MKRLGLFIAVVSVLAAAGARPAALGDPVRIDTGLLSGTTSGDVRIFRGIPFAAPPVAELRWQAPQPAASWDEVRTADRFSPRCMQGGGGAAAQPVSEDCLYLNVWTPASSASERRPVMVWFYGGAFTGGSGSEPRYDGEALARKGAVVVTMNYRLGVFGWLAHPELTRESGRGASGNYGLMDAVASLEWVRRNIASFGGDPANVTIFGESAGAGIVAALVGSPHAKGLFGRAMAQSSVWGGLSIAPMIARSAAEQDGVKVAADLNARSSADLRAKPAEEVLKQARGTFRPIVDGWLVPEDLAVTYAQGRQNRVDVLVGSNQDEGTFFARGPATASEWVTRARERFGNMAEAYLKLYPAASDAQANTSYLAAYSDELAWLKRYWASSQAKTGGAAYLYYFTRVPPVAPGRPSRGATHTAELPYMFNNLLDGTPWTDVDRTLAGAMSSYWVNFAATGNPNRPELANWPAFRDGERALVLGDTISAGQVLDAQKTTFYDAAFERHLATLATLLR